MTIIASPQGERCTGAVVVELLADQTDATQRESKRAVVIVGRRCSGCPDPARTDRRIQAERLTAESDGGDVIVEFRVIAGSDVFEKAAEFKAVRSLLPLEVVRNLRDRNMASLRVDG